MICEKIKNIAYYMRYAHDNSLRKYNLTSTQFLVLEYLIQNEGKDIIQKDICDYLKSNGIDNVKIRSSSASYR